MGLQSIIVRRIDVLVTTSSFLGILFLPGVIMHELGHVAVCRLLRVEVQDITLGLQPRDTLRPYRSPSVRVAYDPDDTWKPIVAAAGPIFLNTAGALTAFALVRYVFLPTGFIWIPAGLADMFNIYLLRTPFTASPLEHFLGLLSLWIGVTMALTAVPSTEDARIAFTLAAQTDGVEYYFALIIASVVYLLGTPWIGLDFVYGAAITAFGLVGPGFAMAIWQEYLFFIGISVLIAAVIDGPRIGPVLFRRWKHSEYSLFDLEPLTIGRIDGIHQRTQSGRSITDEEIEIIVGRLDHPSERVRVSAARALHTVADAEPERMPRWEDEIIDRWYVEPSPEGRFHLLGVLIEAEDCTSNRERFRDVAITALSDEFASVSSLGTSLVGYLSLHDPQLLSDHIGALVGMLDHPKEIARRNIAIALSALAEAGPSSIEPFVGELRPYRDDPDEKVADEIAEALRHLDSEKESFE